MFLTLDFTQKPFIWFGPIFYRMVNPVTENSVKYPKPCPGILHWDPDIEISDLRKCVNNRSYLHKYTIPLNQLLHTMLESVTEIML